MVAFGEVLWDEYAGAARLGGAPANFAVHSAALGADVHLVSRVGEDARGHEALRLLAERGVSLECTARDLSHPTGRVEVALADGIPRFRIIEGVAWDHIPFVGPMVRLAETADVVYFGTLAQRCEESRTTLRQFLSLCAEGALMVLDLNLRDPFHDGEVVRESLARAHLLKLSEEEWPALRRYLEGPEDEAEYARQLRAQYDLELVVVTLGERGCRVHGAEGVVEAPGVRTPVVDTVGAGDAFTAAFALNYLAGHALAACAAAANAVGAYVTGQPGATPPLPARFRCAWC